MICNCCKVLCFKEFVWCFWVDCFCIKVLIVGCFCEFWLRVDCLGWIGEVLGWGNSWNLILWVFFRCGNVIVLLVKILLLFLWGDVFGGVVGWIVFLFFLVNVLICFFVFLIFIYKIICLVNMGLLMFCFVSWSGDGRLLFFLLGLVFLERRNFIIFNWLCSIVIWRVVRFLLFVLLILVLYLR